MSPGFTLLELLVAAALAVLLGAAVTAVFGRGLAAWGTTQAQLQTLFEMEKGLTQLGADLRNAVALSDQPFQRTETNLLFLRQESSTRLASLEWRVEDQQGGRALVRQWRTFPEKEEEPPLTKTLFSDITDWTIQFGMEKEQEGAKAFQWSPGWAPTDPLQSLPKLLRVQVGAQDARGRPVSLTREFWIPHGVLGSVSDGEGLTP